MPRSPFYLTAETAPPLDYGPEYYAKPNGELQPYFQYDPDRDQSRAQAIADAVGLPHRAKVLDFGCGTGVMTAAFNAIGHPTIGVDFSLDAIKRAEETLPQVRGRVHHIGPGGVPLSEFPNDLVSLVLAKDIFEHMPEDLKLPETVEQLLCIGRQVLAVIPTTDEEGNFICGVFEQDKTHVTRLSKKVWLGFFACTTARELSGLTPQIRPSRRQADGTLSLLLEEDPEGRAVLMKERLRVQSLKRRRLLGRQSRGSQLDFDSLYRISNDN